VREGEPTGEYYWLRQSVTFTADGQTRTLEIAVPVHLGASAAEIDALMAQASAGMAQLTRALDARVAAALAPQSAPQSALPDAPVEVASPQRPVVPAAPLDTPEHAGRAATPAPTATVREPQPLRPAAPRPGTAAAPSSTTSAVPVRPTTAASPAASVPSSTRPSFSPGVPAARGGSSAPFAPSPAVAAGPELSRPEFLAAVAQLGLKPKDAMDKLGKRSLEGLNLREALEALRRQILRDSATPSAPAADTAPVVAPPSGPTSAAPARPAPARPAAASPQPATPAPARAPSYFDEEDEADFSFTVDEEGSPAEEPGDEVAGESDEPLYEPDEDDLDDVPDFGPPPGRSSAPPAASRTRARAESAHPAPVAPPPAAPNPAASRTHDLIAQMRAATPGGTASAQQRTAYRNIIEHELGEASARALVQSLWRVTPDRLGPDQYDALISWGKQDTFADDVPLVLAALDAERRAERERAASGSAGAAGTGGTGGTSTRAASPAASPSTLRRQTKPGTSGTTRGEG
jgi:hypothetical protein